MTSATTEKFRKLLAKLPESVQQQARQTYQVWKRNNYHPSLHFKPVHNEQPIYSVRIGLSYRALEAIQGDAIIWFWIGTHEKYNSRIKQL